MARILQPNGKPFTPAQYEQIFKENPDLRVKYNKYGYEESSGLKNLGRGALRSLQDMGDAGNYGYAKLKDWWNEGKKGYKPVTKEVSDRNIKSEQDYQEMTDGSVAAGLGRFGGSVLTPGLGGPSVLIRGVATAAKLGTKLPSLNKIILATTKAPTISKSYTKTALKGARDGMLGYLSTGAKDENSASLKNILTYGAGGGALAAGAGRLIGGPSGAAKKMSDIGEHVSQGFAVPPSSMPHAPIGKALEGIAGKNNVKNEIAIRNTANAQRLARKELGLPVNSDPITDVEIALAKEAPNKIRNEISNSGAVVYPNKNKLKELTDEFYSRLDTRPANVPNLKKALEDGYTKNSYHVSEMLDSSQFYRDLASDLYSSSDSHIRKFGDIPKRFSKEIDDSINSSLNGNMINDLNRMRKDYSKIYSVRDARDFEKLNPLKLARKNKPYTGGLKSISDFARAYPNVAHSKFDRADYLNAGNILRSSVLGAGGGLFGGPYYSLLSLLPPAASKIVSHPLYQRAATSKLVNYPAEIFGLLMQTPGVLGEQAGAAQRFMNPSNLEEY